ncbi:hypothetical protein pb186bvf_020723 [Paramecium bursaria]
MEIQQKYDAIQAYIKSGKSNQSDNLDNSDKLTMYAFFKQINSGPCTGAAPSKLKMVERAKYDAWKKLGNMTKQKAQEEFIKFFEKKYPNWNQQPKL